MTHVSGISGRNMWPVGNKTLFHNKLLVVFGEVLLRLTSAKHGGITLVEIEFWFINDCLIH